LIRMLARCALLALLVAAALARKSSNGASGATTAAAAASAAAALTEMSPVVAAAPAALNASDSTCEALKVCTGDSGCGNNGKCRGEKVGTCNCDACVFYSMCDTDSDCGGLKKSCVSGRCQCWRGSLNRQHIDMCNSKRCQTGSDSCNGLPCNTGICECGKPDGEMSEVDKKHPLLDKITPMIATDIALPEESLSEKELAIIEKTSSFPERDLDTHYILQQSLNGLKNPIRSAMFKVDLYKVLANLTAKHKGDVPDVFKALD
ncbi:hypothetical protein PFISCL1PPCAC_17641, partial [Pristionchus fissidentatus]